MRRLAVLLAWGLVSSCATRGTLDIDCRDLAATALPAPQLVKDIQGGAATVSATPKGLGLGGDRELELLSVPDDRTANSPMFLKMLGSTKNDPAAVPTAHLLLSGGGQWGAFGAGFLSALYRGDKLPKFATVTGVSTGGLQALFIGALGDPAIDKNPAAAEQLFASLIRAYRPASEGEVVNRSSRKELAVLTGSFAGLSPLRGRLLSALCDDPVRPTTCPIIRSLAKSQTKVFLGFVKAQDGGFYFSDVTALAQRAYADTAPAGRTVDQDDLAEAQRCIAGAALASLAMPVFFQQVRVGSVKTAVKMTTYYDGGVRQSVFEIAVATTLIKAVALAQSQQNKTQDLLGKPRTPVTVPPLYVLRNGPTVMLTDEPASDYDKKSNIIDAALRAEAILVNQLEVQSIADLRLADPYGPILFRTADGFRDDHNTPGDFPQDPRLPPLPWYRSGSLTEHCLKLPKDAMFSPSFMACIMRFGRARAEGTAEPGKVSPAWLTLSPLNQPQAVK